MKNTTPGWHVLLPRWRTLNNEIREETTYSVSENLQTHSPVIFNNVSNVTGLDQKFKLKSEKIFRLKI